MDNVKEPKLKSCPFCGGAVQYMRGLEFPVITGIYCRSCKSLVKLPIEMKSKETFGENEEKWAEKWNRRVEK